MNAYENYNDDPELAYALKMSMMEEESKQTLIPEEPTDSDDPATVVNVQLRMPDGNRLTRKFFEHNQLQDVINFVKKTQNSSVGKSVKLIMIPRKQIDEPEKTFKDYGIKKQEAFIVEIK